MLKFGTPKSYRYASIQSVLRRMGLTWKFLSFNESQAAKAIRSDAKDFISGRYARAYSKAYVINNELWVLTQTPEVYGSSLHLTLRVDRYMVEGQ